jgi:hypothetical protein
LTGATSSAARFWPIVAHGKCVGHLLSRGVAGVEAFGVDDRAIGIFPNALAALTAISEKAIADA